MVHLTIRLLSHDLIWLHTTECSFISRDIANVYIDGFVAAHGDSFNHLETWEESDSLFADVLLK